jgi:glycosyltransferase involved in cell wall biosynthesis
LVVVDNGSTDETLSIAQLYADRLLLLGPERSAQRNAGAAATSAEIVGFVDSDMILPPRVTLEVAAAIAAGATAVVVPERTVGEGFWAAVRAYERSFYEGSEAIEAPRFFLRSEFDASGGFDESLTGPEDWDLGIRMRERGTQVRIDSVILHSEGRVRYLDACRKKAYYAPGVARFLRKHGPRGVALFSRRPWLRQPRALAQPLGLGLLALKLGEAGAVVAALTADRVRTHVLHFGKPGARDAQVARR